MYINCHETSTMPFVVNAAASLHPGLSSAREEQKLSFNEPRSDYITRCHILKRKYGYSTSILSSKYRDDIREQTNG